MDNFEAHSNREALNLLQTKGFSESFFPPNTTGGLQPMDVGINSPVKAKVKSLYMNWQVDRFLETRNISCTVFFKYFISPLSF